MVQQSTHWVLKWFTKKESLVLFLGKVYNICCGVENLNQKKVLKITRDGLFYYPTKNFSYALSYKTLVKPRFIRVFVKATEPVYRVGI